MVQKKIKTKKPLVSVNIRTYNSEKYLKETLESVVNQTYKNIEILVSDGYSKDKSVEIAKSFRARIGYADKLGDARHQNFVNSRGYYILSLDSDQALDKKLIEVLVANAQEKDLDAITISERSLINKDSNFVERLIAYDKWVIDKNKDDHEIFGTACPRFFKKEFLKRVKWPSELSIFDDTILYSEIKKIGAKTGYLSKPHIYHHEVKSFVVISKKFFRYGKGYIKAFNNNPHAVSAHSLPRRSYFSRAAFSKPLYFLGLIFIYFLKVVFAGLGALGFIIFKK